LLAPYCDINIQSNTGLTPLLIAAKQGNVELVQTLLQYKPNVDMADKQGRTPIWEAANNGSLEIVRILFLHDADLSVPGLLENDIMPYSPRQIAQLNGHNLIVSFLKSAEVIRGIQKGNIVHILKGSNILKSCREFLANLQLNDPILYERMDLLEAIQEFLREYESKTLWQSPAPSVRM
jgi:hypothetical protein